ncbi:hypothetical protein CDAR_498241 [Caerostris darwini]|uniref:Uncharacterized protein n=1 Tax=Caerostris darwini TaxID=1538125 RepID=A0AAV4U011_9ARAC|nr:hypothetical protein CDAR_498241 [Caerostris darwini]
MKAISFAGLAGYRGGSTINPPLTPWKEELAIPFPPRENPHRDRNISLLEGKRELGASYPILRGKSFAEILCGACVVWMVSPFLECNGLERLLKSAPFVSRLRCFSAADGGY